MATLVLTAVGNFVGGPIGGAIGSLIGQAVDARIFAPKPNEGPRLKELAVQTSQYGTAIPALFGRMRVAGTVIWSTDLIESKTKSGNGKGRPATINYSYRVSFAVALSSRRAERVGRIWADGQLIRTNGGALSPGGVLRFYQGDDAQSPDPLIAAAVGVGQCPAYRGLAYAVLEDVPLADFGNRIPSLTFEVIADEGAISLDTMARYASDGRLTAPDATPLIGYAAEGADLDAWLSPLIAAEGRVLTRQGQELGLGMGLGQGLGHDFALIAPNAVSIATPPVLPNDRVSHLNGAKQDIGGATIPTVGAAQPSYSLRYYDVGRDYQIAVQASVGGDQSLPQSGVDLPAVMDADTAAALIHRIAQGRRTGAQGEDRIIPEIWADTLPIGALYTVAGSTRAWQVTEREWLNGAVHLTARTFTTASPLAVTGSSGTHIASGLADVGATHLLAVELPALPNLTTTAFVTAAGEGTGWRGAMAYADNNGMANPLGWIARGAVMGSIVTGLPLHHGLLGAPDTVLEVDVLHADMALPPAELSAPPLLWMNGEIISYTDAVPVTATRWRITGLTRALYTTAAAAHPEGSVIVVLDEAMPHWPLSLSTTPIGMILTYSAEGAADDLPATADLNVQHLSQRPPAPVHGQWRRDADGLTLTWTRRCRTPAQWQDYVDMPLGEATERYQIAAGDTVWESGAPTITLPIIALPLLAPPAGGSLIVHIRQIGDSGASQPLTLNIPVGALS